MPLGKKLYAVLVAILIIGAVAFLVWRDSYNAERKLLWSLRTIALTTTMYKSEQGAFPEKLSVPPHSGVSEEVLENVVYTAPHAGEHTFVKRFIFQRVERYGFTIRLTPEKMRHGYALMGLS